MIQIILLVLLGILSAFEEVQQLIQRGSWKREDYRYPEWFTDVNGKWKNWDSHHFAFGLFVLIMFEILISYLPKWMFINHWLVEQLWVYIYWQGFFYFRNIFMHIVFKKKPLWVYLWKI